MTTRYSTSDDNLSVYTEEEEKEWASESDCTDTEPQIAKPSVSADLQPAKSQVICVASGKGGTGKTMFAVNLAVLLAREGLKTILVDADFGLANAHLLLGVEPQDDVSSVFSGQKTVADIIVDAPEGLKLLPGGSGLSELAMLGDERFLHLIKGLHCLEERADIIVVDLPAGINPQVMCLLNAAHEMIIVTTPEVTSLVDAYALIKSLSQISKTISPQIIINKAPDKERAAVAFQKILNVTSKHLGGKVTPKLLGWIPQNWYVLNSVASRKPLVLRHPQCFATACIELMAAKTIKRHAQWVDHQAEHYTHPSYFSRLEQLVYGS